MRALALLCGARTELVTGRNREHLDGNTSHQRALSRNHPAKPCLTPQVARQVRVLAERDVPARVAQTRRVGDDGAPDSLAAINGA